MRDLTAHTMSPCLSCGGKDVKLESMRPEGRVKDVWRVVCSCGEASKQWSVSEVAAIRAWNRNLAKQEDI